MGSSALHIKTIEACAARNSGIFRSTVSYLVASMDKKVGYGKGHREGKSKRVSETAEPN